ncbi:MAG: phosphoadenosine phosphosulfate reductase family protein [Christensenellaceae bacterium]|jgi:3'-phosphoadenosine 5'-phosphosulfate sulfotransferase (PAPS reductase)/FAD synthetase|nr:phosphoadenosine phosphosulfate reductase family protein [Christensenellaceae bacterium]
MKYIASCSFGKDSLAMVLRLIEKGTPLDEVMFYDTGMEFKAIYSIRDAMLPIFAQAGIKYTELKPPNSFLYDMLERPVVSKQKGSHLGYGWCGGVCRWGTTFKTQSLDAHAQGATLHYVGIAADEPNRLNRLEAPKCAPLAEEGMTEADCLAYCRAKGFSWDEDGVDLYGILDRVSCWCCSNKNLKELRNIYKHLPGYWEALKDLQSQIERPMKRYSSKGIPYGNVFQLDKKFKEEDTTQ